MFDYISYKKTTASGDHRDLKEKAWDCFFLRSSNVAFVTKGLRRCYWM